MSAQANRPVAALMSPAQASTLLDHVVYERVVSFFDFGELIRFEQDLSAALSECGFSDTAVPQVASEMINRALVKFAVEHSSYPIPRNDCERCEQELARSE